MAIEFWESQQRRKGNVSGAEMARVLREQFGDEKIPSTLLDPDQAARKVRDELQSIGGVSTRTINSLFRAIKGKRLMVYSAQELQRVPDVELSAARLIGPKSIQEIREVLPYSLPNSTAQ